MDPSLILVFLVLNLAYLAVLLARRDLRLYRAQVLLYGLLIGVYGTMLASEPGQPALAVAVTLFVVVVVVPLVLQRRLMAMMSAERARRGLVTVAAINYLLTWSRASAHMLEIARALDRLDDGKTAEALERSCKTLEGIENLSLQAGLAQLLAAAFCARRHWREGVHIHDAYVMALGARIEDASLINLVRAYLEVGDLERAIALQAALENSPLADYPPLAQHARLGRIFLYALTGNPRQVAELFETSGDLLEGIPGGAVDYWQGRAELAAGRAEAAREHFERALESTPADEPMWRRVIGEFSAAAASPAAAAAARSRFPLTPPELDGALARRTAGAPRPAGARLVAVSTGERPLTLGLLLVNAAVFAFMEAAGSSTTFANLVRFGAIVRPLVDEGEAWRLVTAMFIHIGFVHLLLNGVGLYFLGSFIEEIYGAARFGVIYVGAGLAASCASCFFGLPYDASAGASGAVFGLLGCAIGFGLRFRTRLPPAFRSGYLFTLLFILSIQVVMGFSMAGIDNAAHLGGAAAGIVAGLVLSPGRTLLVARDPDTSKTSAPERVLVGALAVVCAAAVGYGLVWGAVHALGGGYPARPVAMQRLDRGDRGYSLEVPRFWRVVEHPPESDGSDLLLSEPWIGERVLVMVKRLDHMMYGERMWRRFVSGQLQSQRKARYAVASGEKGPDVRFERRAAGWLAHARFVVERRRRGGGAIARSVQVFYLTPHLSGAAPLRITAEGPADPRPHAALLARIVASVNFSG